MALVAQIQVAEGSGDARGARRRTLRLDIPASAAAESSSALIHNLSERGLLIETPIDLAAGDSLQVELPEIGTVCATVEWAQGRLMGCSFDEPVPTSVVSAALLRSPADLPALSVGEIIPPKELTGEVSADRVLTALDDGTALHTAMIISLVLTLIAVLIFLSALLTFAAPSH